MAVIVVNWMPITGKVVVKMENHLYPQGCEIAPVIEASFEEVPIQNLFIVLAGEVASVSEIKAYQAAYETAWHTFVCRCSSPLFSFAPIACFIR